MQEIFKDIPNYEGIYQVSNLGKVKSLSRQVFNGKVNYLSKEKILKECIDSTGYIVFGLCRNGKMKTIGVHRLIAMAFLNHKTTKNLVVDHINNNRLDNRLENLQIISHRENCSKDRKNCSSSFIGVCWDKDKNKWISNIYINGFHKTLGFYDSEIEASFKYRKSLEMIKAGDLSFLKTKENSSKYKGVSFHKIRNKWQAAITINKKRTYLGLFKTENEAYQAYINALNLKQS
jgi:hypothetical protein